jgi:hypothetical protein
MRGGLADTIRAPFFFTHTENTTMAKMRMNELRTILARANDIVAEYDANRAAETGEDDATPPHTEGMAHRAPAQDAAIRSGAYVADEDPIRAARSRATRAAFGENWTRLSR